MSFKIYQVYHIEELESSLLNKEYIIPYYTQYTKGLNYLQSILNEFVCQYYVYKYEKYNDDDVVGFYHYRRYFIPTDKEFVEIENNVKNKNTVYALGLYNIKNILNHNNKKNSIFITLNDYISHEYPEMTSKFQNLDWGDNSIRFECFISRYDDFCKYVKFVLGYFRYIGFDLEKCNIQQLKQEIDNGNFLIEYYNIPYHRWYICKKNHYRKIAYIIELLCALYWSLFGKDIKVLWKENIYCV